MILSEIKEFFKERSAASLADLSIRFNVDPGAMRGMLDQWIRKGRLKKMENICSCSNCCSNCKPEHMEIYEWIEERCGQC